MASEVYFRAVICLVIENISFIGEKTKFLKATFSDSDFSDKQLEFALRRQGNTILDKNTVIVNEGYKKNSDIMLLFKLFFVLHKMLGYVRNFMLT